ncbi:unnamed protein product [Arabidopsis lyrata]|uniref:Tetratricopeptide repeat-containing protein n=3 Tax=Arabidopsis lyrata subsp. lyrata TaxID=81972 RepID=D7KLU5_ARALL|nr:tetratricopeptide repeat-containing protein [Arabidopsis lyrata subsp. lyrata]CAH8253236.1 unnamed protein product [Arabidopsis lyrata]
MLLQTLSSSSPPIHRLYLHHSQILPSSGSPKKISLQIHGRTLAIRSFHEISARGLPALNKASLKKLPIKGSTFLLGQSMLMVSAYPQMAAAAEIIKPEPIYEVGELFELSIQLSYLLLLLGLLGVGTFYVIRQVLVRRELDLSAKELQEQVRSGDASATELFELGAVMLRRKFYPAANKFLQQAIQKWDGDDQDLAQVYNALGVSYVREDKLDKGIAQFEMAVKLQPGYVTAWNNLGDAYEKKKELPLALKAFEEVLLFDPNNKVARPRRDALKDRVKLYKGVVSVKSKKR